jgi:hypothetical protein
MATDELLKERGKTHGNWREQSACATELKQLCLHHQRSRSFNPSQSEGLLHILNKISRIVCGNPNEPDHWRDIAGYATLVAKELENNGLVERSPSAAGTRKARGPYRKRAKPY